MRLQNENTYKLQCVVIFIHDVGAPNTGAVRALSTQETDRLSRRIPSWK